MLSQSPKLSKKERRRRYEDHIEIQREKSKFESKDNDQSVSSWDFVYYMMKYNSKE
jgi:hypothetical protein